MSNDFNVDELKSYNPEKVDKDNKISRAIKYYHFRLTDKDGELSNFGGITICTIFNKEGNILLGVARCSKKDRYSRKLGRIKSFFNLKSKILSTKNQKIENYGGDENILPVLQNNNLWIINNVRNIAAKLIKENAGHIRLGSYFKELRFKKKVVVNTDTQKES